MTALPDEPPTDAVGADDAGAGAAPSALTSDAPTTTEVVAGADDSALSSDGPASDAAAVTTARTSADNAPTPISTPPPPARPLLWPVFVAALLFLVPLFGLSGLLVVAYMLSGTPVEGLLKAPGFLALSAVASAASMVVAGLGAPWLLKDAAQGLRHRLRWHPERTRPLDVVLLTVAMISVGSALEEAARGLGLYGGALQDISDAVAKMSGLELAAVLVTAAAGAGLGEELFFRGLVQTRLVQRWGAVGGIVVASFFFGAVHGDWLHSPLAFGMGLVLGWAAFRSGTIVTGVFAHALNNAASFVLIALGVSTPPEWSFAAGAVAAVVGALSVWALHGRWRSLTLIIQKAP